MKKIKIFLASSEELKQERLEIADFVEHLNHTFEKVGLSIQLVKWEYLDSSMGVQHKQDDYNDALKDCEMCIVIYWTRFGMYTKTELDTAYNRLKQGDNPQKLYVYFKDEDENHEVTRELKEFRDSFPREYGHFENRFKNIDTLKSQFLLQFIEYQSNTLKSSPLIEVRDAKIIMGGKVYVDLMNVPFVGNNDEYTDILKRIEKQKRRLGRMEIDDEDYPEEAQELRELEEKKEKMEASLWDTALDITRLSNQKCSERLQRAIDLFNKGDNKGASAILNEEEIYRDAENNLNLIKLGEEGRKGLITNIEELKLKVKTLENEMRPDRMEKVFAVLEKIKEYTKNVYGEFSKEYVDCLTETGYSYRQFGKYQDALNYHQLSHLIFNQTNLKDNILLASILSNISWDLIRLGKFDDALSLGLDALEIRIKELGETDLNTAYSYNNVGGAYHGLNSYDKALEYFSKGFVIRKNIFGDSSIETSRSYHNVGLVYKRLGDFDKALEYLLKGLEIRKNILGDNTAETAKSYNNIGLVYRELGNIEKTLEYRKKALVIRQTNLGDNHPDTISSYNGVGWTLYTMGKYDEALDYARKAVEYGAKVLSNDHHRMGEYFDTLGSIYEALGKNQEASKYLGNAYDNAKKNKRKLAFRAQRFADILFKTGDIEGAKEKYEEALELLPEGDESRQLIGEMLKKIKNSL